jgi:adenine-specific DNA-methyltransferase
MPTLNWIGKAAVETHHKDVPFHLVEPISELSCGAAKSGNLIIHGDNLLALKALLPRYAGKVKCIYIDPPYNTGNEGWKYNDNVNSPEIKKWLGEVVGKEGETLDRHDRWLSMMYPRMLLLKQFLTDDGVIFVSIDDDEMHHLRCLMDEIFGISRRLATLVWRTDGNFDNQAKIKNCHEYILAYSINPEKFPYPDVVDPSVGASSKLNNAFIQNTIVKNGPKNPVSEVLLPQGFPSSVSKAVIKSRTDAWPHYLDDVKIEDSKLTSDVRVSSGWSSRSILMSFIESKFQPVLDSKGQKTRFVITGTGAIESIKDREQASHVITVVSGVGSTQSQSVALSEMGFQFPFPKPVDLVQYLISMIEGNDFLVLDSFGGSGTTAHAVLNLNKKDGGTRRFILVEMDKKIANEVTQKRVAKIVEGYISTKNESIEPLGGDFQFCQLSKKPLFQSDGTIDPNVTYLQMAEFVWFMETGTGLSDYSATAARDTPYIGSHKGKDIFLLYNGILKDGSELGGNVLNGRTLNFLNEVAKNPTAPKIVYASRTRFDKAKLNKLGITFHQLPYELAVKTWL